MIREITYTRMKNEFETLAFDHAPLGLIYAENRTIRRCNDRLAEMFGYRVNDLEGCSFSVLYPTTEEFRRIGNLGLAKMQDTGRYEDERIMRRRDETHLWCRVRGQSLDRENPFARSVWSFSDISAHRPTAEMTVRERQVAKMMAEGLTSKEIARGLGISPRTVDVHRARLLEKFSARNSLELIARLTGLPI